MKEVFLVWYHFHHSKNKGYLKRIVNSTQELKERQVPLLEAAHFPTYAEAQEKILYWGPQLEIGTCVWGIDKIWIKTYVNPQPQKPQKPQPPEDRIGGYM